MSVAIVISVINVMLTLDRIIFLIVAMVISVINTVAMVVSVINVMFTLDRIITCMSVATVISRSLYRTIF